MMDFMRSTQARSWMFDEISLENCRREAVRVVASPSYEGGDTSEYSAPRKFASGFHHRNGLSLEKKPSDHARSDASNHLTISANEQEQLIRFHAQQIKPLVGPDAVLDELRKSEDVLLTAIMFLRRFFLSNTVVDIHPRRIAIACAFFASKVEEEPVTLDDLAHASTIIEKKVKASVLCRGELCSISVAEIEDAERLLMEGLNYEFRCYHPNAVIQCIAPDIPLTNLMSSALKREVQEGEQRDDLLTRDSPSPSREDHAAVLPDYVERALKISQRVLIFSDINFLHTPEEIAVVIWALLLLEAEGNEEGSLNERLVYDFVVSLFHCRPQAELRLVSVNVQKVVRFLIKCPFLDLMPTSNVSEDEIKEQAKELKMLLHKVADQRFIRWTQHKRATHSCCPRKRSRMALDFTPPHCGKRTTAENCTTRVTPPGLY